MEKPNFVDLTPFATEELENDLRECAKDIEVCRGALRIGVLSHHGRSVRERLSRNTLLHQAIENELDERKKNANT